VAGSPASALPSTPEENRESPIPSMEIQGDQTMVLKNGSDRCVYHVTFLIGVANICKHFNFGRDFFFECLKLGMPCKKINNRYVVTVKKVDEFIENQMNRMLPSQEEARATMKGQPAFTSKERRRRSKK
jgi:hypothetical protein